MCSYSDLKALILPEVSRAHQIKQGVSHAQAEISPKCCLRRTKNMMQSLHHQAGGPLFTQGAAAVLS
jgi:hypothetical protein